MALTIIGLGAGSADDLTRGAWRALESAKVVYLRTRQHPCVPHLPTTPEYHAFDELYEAYDDFKDVYSAIVARVLEAARAAPAGELVYAVPGDPFVAEATTRRLVEACAAESIPCVVLAGVSFIEPICRALKIDPTDGLQLLDALDIVPLHHPPINPDLPALLSQVYSRAVASDLKLTLMNQYPDEFEVALIHAAGTADERIETVPLYAIDRSPNIGVLTALYVPALGGMSSFERFQETIAHLRAPEGCPWDREQTHLSLRKYLLEEAYEVLEALDNQDSAALLEELGDLLLQIVLHAQIAVDDGEFRMGDVISAINRKLIRRHPHVWGEVEVDSAGQVVANWDAIKRQEYAEKGIQRASLLDGVPKALPALMQAYEYQAKAAKVGFDWDDSGGALAKVREEIAEVIAAPSADERFNEMGDLLFAVVNWGRWLKIDPEQALRATAAKFYRRFNHVEAAAAAQGKALKDMTLAEMDALWDEAKGQGL